MSALRSTRRDRRPRVCSAVNGKRRTYLLAERDVSDRGQLERPHGQLAGRRLGGAGEHPQLVAATTGWRAEAEQVTAERTGARLGNQRALRADEAKMLVAPANPPTVAAPPGASQEGAFVSTLRIVVRAHRESPRLLSRRRPRRRPRRKRARPTPPPPPCARACCSRSPQQLPLLPSVAAWAAKVGIRPQISARDLPHFRHRHVTPSRLASLVCSHAPSRMRSSASIRGGSRSRHASSAP